MSIFIKTGFWEKTKKGYKDWLNLSSLIEEVAPPPLPYKEFYFFAEGQGVQPTLIFNNTFDVTPVFSSGASGTTVVTSPGAFPDTLKVIIDYGNLRIHPNPVFDPTIDKINVLTTADTYVSIRIYN
jgi:hypothetical protein